MPTNFDDFTERYTDLHARSIRASGEPPRYFAEYKVQRLRRLGAETRAPLLDFGSGIGNLTEVLLEHFHDVHAYDPSQGSVAVARERIPAATHHDRLDTVPVSHFATAVLSGVLHHVSPAARTGLLREARERLRPGGRLVVFEHNPLNPLTRRAVDQCPYDADAILVYPWQLKRSLRAAGFEDVSLDYIVFFPRLLARLRPYEPRLGWCALGAQTMAVGRRP